MFILKSGGNFEMPCVSHLEKRFKKVQVMIQVTVTAPGILKLPP